MARNWCDCSPRRGPARCERARIPAGQRLEHRPLLEELALHLLHPGEDLEARDEQVGLHVLDRRGELVDHELHPQLRGLVLDDEEHLSSWCAERGRCAASSAASCR